MKTRKLTSRPPVWQRWRRFVLERPLAAAVTVLMCSLTCSYYIARPRGPGVSDTAETAGATADSQAATLSEANHALVSWIVANGGSVDKVDIKMSPSAPDVVDQQLDASRKSWHVGWTLREDVPLGVPYLTIPTFLTLGKSTAPKSRCHAILKLLRTLFEGHVGSRMETIELYVLVHFERFLEGSLSFWWPFLSSLPDAFPELPAFLPEADRALLSSMPQGGHAMAAYFNATDLIVHVVADTLITRFPKAYRLSLAELEHQLRWAFAVVHNFAVHPSSDEAKVELIIIPGITYANQDAAAQSGDILSLVRKGSLVTSIQLVAAKDRAAGDAVVLGFGNAQQQLCAVDFLLKFGYLPKGSAYDCFYYRLKLNPFEGDQAAEAVRQELLASFANDVRIVDESSVELKFFDDVSAASRLVQCYAVTLMRPFQFANAVSIRNGMRQLAELSKQNMVIQLRLLLESMRTYFDDFIQGANITDYTFEMVYKLQERSERVAYRILHQLDIGR